MIDNLAYAIKIFCAVIAVWSVSKGSMSALMVLLIPLFMTGVEFITHDSSTWSYLFSGLATTQDYEKALLGGVLFTAISSFIFLIIGKDSNALPMNLDDQEPNEKVQGVKKYDNR